MKNIPIILASRSKARRELLRRLGIRFCVVVPRVKECAASARAPEAAAKANALMKARDVARRVRRGVIIACDTFVVQAGHICGKPKDMSDARRMLKRLSHRPHVLYTGIAVIDAGRKKEWVDCARTKITMDPLSDRQIRAYFRKVSPLDKAGAFDIQGRGGLFIRRIEGCYFNVVGLPLANMARLLKKAGVSLLLALFVFSLGGCATTEYNVATQKQDLMFYSTDSEVAMGDALARQVEKNYKVIVDREQEERLQRVGQRIAAVADRQEIMYRFRIIEDEKEKDIVNAVSLPGGYIYVFRELLKVADTDDELAAVLAHEVAHIVARHQIKRLQAIWGYNILGVLALQARNADFAQGAQLAYVSLMSGYAQEDELLADRMGARYVGRAGLDPNGMVLFLEKLKDRQRKEPLQALTYFRTHPHYGERVKATKEEIGQEVTFADYINAM